MATLDVPTGPWGIRMHRRRVLAAVTLLIAGGLAGCIPGPGVPFSTDHIVKVAEATQGAYHAEFYENRAYTCGVSGYHTFVVAWPDGMPTDEPRPLWARLHGGGSGAFNEAGQYVPSFYFDSLDQETFGELGGFGFQAGLMAAIRAHPAGFRAVIPSLCDHDTYAGVGLADPNNPFSPDENGNTRATDGMLAAEAAVAFARSEVNTTATFVHGTSAGSAGAFHVAYGLEEHGDPVTGIVMDSGLNDHTAFAAFEPYLEQNPGACPTAGFAAWDWDAHRAKFSHLLQPIWEPAYAVEHGLFSTPIFQLWDRRDPGFCADTPIPYTDDDGTQKVLGAVDLQNDDLRAAIAANPPGGAGASVSLRVCTETGPSTCGMHSPTTADSTDADTGLDINQAIIDWVDARLRYLTPGFAATPTVDLVYGDAINEDGLLEQLRLDLYTRRTTPRRIGPSSSMPTVAASEPGTRRRKPRRSSRESLPSGDTSPRRSTTGWTRTIPKSLSRSMTPSSSASAGRSQT